MNLKLMLTQYEKPNETVSLVFVANKIIFYLNIVKYFVICQPISQIYTLVISVATSPCDSSERQ